MRAELECQDLTLRPPEDGTGREAPPPSTRTGGDETAASPGRSSSLAGDLAALTKARLTSLVLLTTAAGFALGSAGQMDGWRLGWTLIGTALLAGGAAALNQHLERDLDGRMERTRDRPLPAGRIPPRAAWVGGLLAGIAGVLTLVWWVNLPSALLGAYTLVTYVWVYTPLKRRSTVNTLVGAVPGALPPVIGWAAAGGDFGWAAGALFAIQFFWQIPHFLAIAWLYRVDYARAGLRMLPVLDPGGRRTGAHAVGHAVALWLVSLLPWRLGLAGGLYAVTATLAGLGFVLLALHFARHRRDRAARGLFLGSVLYLPLVLGTMVLDRAG